MIRLLTVVALLLGVVTWTSVIGQAPSDTLVLPNVTVIDGTGSPSRAEMTIVIRNGRIAELFPSSEREPPAGATTLDVAGRYVIPGLIDTHVHLAAIDRPAAIVASLLRATLFGGVTTVRDMGGNGEGVAELMRSAADIAGAPSPAILVSAVFAGPQAVWFTGSRARYLSGGHEPGTAPWLVRVDNRTNVRAAVRRAKAWGATGVKLHSHLSPGQMRDIANEARRQNLGIWSRATVMPARPEDAVNARAQTLSHADLFVWQGRTGVPAAQFGTPAGMAEAMDAVAPDSAAITDVLTRMRDRGVALEPLLFAAAQAASFAGDDRPAFDQQLAYGARVTAAANGLGVPVVTGTDAVGGAAPNLHAELQLLVGRAGLTPLQAIRAATWNAARAIGAADVGAVRQGFRADLVVLDRNPADDIRNTQTVVMVLRGGVVHRRTEPMPAPPLAEPPAP